MAINRKKVETVEVLVAALNQDMNILPQKLNLQTDAIICNQCEETKFYDIKHNGKKIRWLNFAERGVGLNRNNAWMRATADVVLFSDDDMIFTDEYEKIVLNLFNQNPKADVIIFNIIEKHPSRKINTKAHYTKKCGYGAARFAVRRETVQMKGISFNLNFGGGAKYSNGEDTLFLADCNRKGLNILVVPYAIAELTEERESTWNCGYTEKYFYDKGILLAASHPSFLYLIELKYAITISKKCQYSWKQIFKFQRDGSKYYKSNF